jgi:hypothetical protein
MKFSVEIAEDGNFFKSIFQIKVEITGNETEFLFKEDYESFQFQIARDIIPPIAPACFIWIPFAGLQRENRHLREQRDILKKHWVFSRTAPSAMHGFESFSLWLADSECPRIKMPKSTGLAGNGRHTARITATR